MSEMELACLLAHQFPPFHCLYEYALFFSKAFSRELAMVMLKYGLGLWSRTC